MPTTATVAPRPVFTGADIASGFRALGNMFDRKPWIAVSVRHPAVPLRFSVPLNDRDDVEALAADHGVPVEEDRNGWVFARVMLGGLEVEFNAQPERTLRRDPEAKAILAERDA